jgi:Collagen triple helix repeat (20 copies)
MSWVDLGNICGPPGATGPTGPTGPMGQGINILGSLDDVSQLPPSANPGDAYFIGPTLYVWTGTEWTSADLEGPTGPTGPTGPAGLTGPSGPTGATGLGATGPTGQQGNTGQAGPIGPTGSQGNPGIQGVPGPPGQQGAVGPAGAGGAQGNPGPAGPPGTGFVGTILNHQLDQGNVSIPYDSWATLFGPFAFTPGYWLIEFAVTAVCNAEGQLELIFAQDTNAGNSMGSMAVFLNPQYACGGHLSRIWGVAPGTTPNLYCNVFNQSAGTAVCYQNSPYAGAVRATSFHAVQLTNT